MGLRMNCVAAGLLLLGCIDTAHSGADMTIAVYLREQSQTPVNYVRSKAMSHQVTLLGEAHWLRQDVSLVAALIPVLQKDGVDLAAEIFPASEQLRIDELIAAPKWNEQSANAVMRAASWPYREYRELLRAAWSTNQGVDRRIRILALGPPADWRDVLLARGETYETFMAALVTKYVTGTRRRLVVYCGMHHAFTRYYQAELDNGGKARGYMDRMGNILSRRFGEEAFLIALHKPVWCGSPAQPTYCLPFGGRLDCEASRIGRPLGFDVAGSPLAEMRFEQGDYYGYGHLLLRFADYTDGYIWSGSIESFRPVTTIPLSEYAPDSRAMEQVAHRNPFNDEVDVSPERLEEIWAQETARNRDLLSARKWNHLSGWRGHCQ